MAKKIPADVQAVLDQARRVVIAFKGYRDDDKGCESKRASFQVLINWLGDLEVAFRAHEDAYVERFVSEYMAGGGRVEERLNAICATDQNYLDRSRREDIAGRSVGARSTHAARRCP